jgi:broad specificity phosphatase PhoE
MKITIGIARHGEDTYNVKNLLNGRTNTELTPNGMVQATQLGKKLQHKNISKIYSSPLDRAYKTAQIISQFTTHTTPEIIPELTERDYGKLTGQPVSNIVVKCSELLWVGQINYPIYGENLDLETLDHVEVRANKILDILKSTHDQGYLLLVCHREIGKVLWCVANNYSWKNGLPIAPNFPNTELLEVTVNF